MKLDDLKRNCLAKITFIEEAQTEKSNLVKKLKDYGFEKGTEVEIMHCGFPNKDPLAVRVGSHMVGLRRSEAKLVGVEVL